LLWSTKFGVKCVQFFPSHVHGHGYPLDKHRIPRQNIWIYQSSWTICSWTCLVHPFSSSASIVHTFRNPTKVMYSQPLNPSASLWSFESYIPPSVPCAVGPSVNPLQNRETQYVNIVLQCMYRFFEQLNMKGNHVWIEW
jgi:hypothetical protein